MLFVIENGFGKFSNLFMCCIGIDQKHDAAQAIPQTPNLLDCLGNVGIGDKDISSFKLFKDVHVYCPLL